MSEPAGEALRVLLALHLRGLDSPDVGEVLGGAALLSREIARSVPSLLGVTLVVRHSGLRIPLTVWGGTSQAPVRASFAVGLGVQSPADELVLQAGEAGAFVLLADDLRTWSPAGAHATLDAHLSSGPGTPRPIAADALADLRAVNRGLGVLIDQGRDVEQARQALLRRAQDAGVSLAQAARAVMARTAPAG